MNRKNEFEKLKKELSELDLQTICYEESTLKEDLKKSEGKLALIEQPFKQQVLDLRKQIEIIEHRCASKAKETLDNIADIEENIRTNTSMMRKHMQVTKRMRYLTGLDEIQSLIDGGLIMIELETPDAQSGWVEHLYLGAEIGNRSNYNTETVIQYLGLSGGDSFKVKSALAKTYRYIKDTGSYPTRTTIVLSNGIPAKPRSNIEIEKYCPHCNKGFEAENKYGCPLHDDLYWQQNHLFHFECPECGHVFDPNPNPSFCNHNDILLRNGYAQEIIKYEWDAKDGDWKITKTTKEVSNTYQ